MSAIGKGDWVEAIRTHPRGIFKPGDVFQISEHHGPFGGGKTCKCHQKDVGGVRLQELQPLYPHQYFCTLNFRPIYRPNSSILTGLLENKYSKEKETA